MGFDTKCLSKQHWWCYSFDLITENVTLPVHASSLRVLPVNTGSPVASIKGTPRRINGHIRVCYSLASVCEESPYKKSDVGPVVSVLFDVLTA
ncbi:hypothetical protein EVAR_38086_1 [Eumeta japonica]|uniref:Uncharacterized protein n=1 Tax=Eumeta variegata TaxID=151549 RepID=A0A4C1W8U6_EUMVA|nr:hypothetical protein EVAR_38086_1 [Eumeta japonica]